VLADVQNSFTAALRSKVCNVVLIPTTAKIISIIKIVIYLAQ